MSNENGIGMNMPVVPAYGMGSNGDGNGIGWWLILLFLLCGNGMWGGFGGGLGGMMWPMMMGSMGGGFGLDYLYPWINNSQNINDGFRNQQLSNQLSETRSDINRGFGDVQLGISGLGRQICETGNDVTRAVTSGFSAAEIAANGRQMANMQQAFAAQTATAQGFNGVQAGIADLRYTEATENCATRAAAANNTRDIIDNQNRVGQAILDKLCALELDGVKGQLAAAQRENVGLQNQLNMATMRESQTAQNAFITQGFANEVDALYNRLSNCPVPTVPVYGRQPIFTCNNNQGCGCGCGAY